LTDVIYTIFAHDCLIEPDKTTNKIPLTAGLVALSKTSGVLTFDWSSNQPFSEQIFLSFPIRLYRSAPERCWFQIKMKKIF